MDFNASTVVCARCNYVNPPQSHFCNGCGVAFGGYAPIDHPAAPSQPLPTVLVIANPVRAQSPISNMNLVLGIAGSLLLVFGVFAPLFSAPIVGDINYFQNGRGDGIVVLILAGISFLLTVTRRYRGLWITGILTAGLLTFTFINFQ